MEVAEAMEEVGAIMEAAGATGVTTTITIRIALTEIRQIKWPSLYTTSLKIILIATDSIKTSMRTRERKTNGQKPRTTKRLLILKPSSIRTFTNTIM